MKRIRIQRFDELPETFFRPIATLLRDTFRCFLLSFCGACFASFEKASTHRATMRGGRKEKVDIVFHIAKLSEVKKYVATLLLALFATVPLVGKTVGSHEKRKFSSFSLSYAGTPKVVTYTNASNQTLPVLQYHNSIMLDFFIKKRAYSGKHIELRFDVTEHYIASNILGDTLCLTCFDDAFLYETYFVALRYLAYQRYPIHNWITPLTFFTEGGSGVQCTFRYFTPYQFTNFHHPYFPYVSSGTFVASNDIYTYDITFLSMVLRGGVDLPFGTMLTSRTTVEAECNIGYEYIRGATLFSGLTYNFHLSFKEEMRIAFPLADVVLGASLGKDYYRHVSGLYAYDSALYFSVYAAVDFKFSLMIFEGLPIP